MVALLHVLFTMVFLNSPEVVEEMAALVLVAATALTCACSGLTVFSSLPSPSFNTFTTASKIAPLILLYVLFGKGF